MAGGKSKVLSTTYLQQNDVSYLYFFYLVRSLRILQLHSDLFSKERIINFSQGVGREFISLNNESV